MIKKKESILTEATLKAGELLKEISIELKKFAPEPFMKRKITKREADIIAREGERQWQ